MVRVLLVRSIQYRYIGITGTVPVVVVRRGSHGCGVGAVGAVHMYCYAVVTQVRVTRLWCGCFWRGPYVLLCFCNAGAGHTAVVRVLLARPDLRIDQRDTEGFTALFHACNHGKYRVGDQHGYFRRLWSWDLRKVNFYHKKIIV